MPSRSRKVIRIAVQTAAVLLLTGLLTEIAFRAVHAIRPIYIFPTATYNRFRAKPGILFYGFPANSAGFLDVETEPRKPPGTYRIVGLGDSFVFGVVPYTHNFLTVLEDELRSVDPAVEVVNMGIPNADPGDYLLLLRKEALALDPDLVIVHFFIGNDFHVRPRYTTEPRSYLETFVRYAVGIRPDFTRQPRRVLRDYVDDAPTMALPRYLKILHRRIALFNRRRPSYLETLPKIARVLADIRDTCRRHGARLAVVVLPEEMQVSWEARRLAIESLPWYQPRHFDYTIPNSALHEELERLDVAYLDLYETFLTEGADTVLYKPRDTHWNLHGNRLAAETIRDYLVGGGWFSRQDDPLLW